MRLVGVQQVHPHLAGLVGGAHQVGPGVGAEDLRERGGVPAQPGLGVGRGPHPGAVPAVAEGFGQHQEAQPGGERAQPDAFVLAHTGCGAGAGVSAGPLPGPVSGPRTGPASSPRPRTVQDLPQGLGAHRQQPPPARGRLREAVQQRLGVEGQGAPEFGLGRQQPVQFGAGPAGPVPVVGPAPVQGPQCGAEGGVGPRPRVGVPGRGRAAGPGLGEDAAREPGAQAGQVGRTGRAAAPHVLWRGHRGGSRPNSSRSPAPKGVSR